MIKMIQRIPAAQEDDESGFTLVELMIAIVILGVLAAIVVFSVNGITNRGNASACAADVNTVQIASEAYYAKNAAYAADIPSLVTANFLRSAPTDVTYTAASGAVTAKTGTSPC